MATSEPFDAPAQGDPASSARPEPAAAQSQPGASGSRASGKTWAHGVPAMRIGRPARWRARAVAENALAAGEGNPSPTAGAPFGRQIRLVRLVVGVVLVAGAWLAALGAYMLGRAALAPVGRLDVDRLRLAERALARLTEALGACFVGVVAAMMILVGAFALSLVIRPADIAAADDAPHDPLAAPAGPPVASPPPEDVTAAGDGEA